VTSTV